MKRKTPMRRKRRTKRRILIDRADRAWSLNIRHRAGWRCEVCGKTTTLQAHHVRPRTYMRARFERLNGVCLCWRCHKQFAHGDAAGFMAWLEHYDHLRYAVALHPANVLPIQRADAELLAIAENLERDNALYDRQAEAA